MSLEKVLRFREKKALLQEKMIRENPGAVIVSLGMNIPGPVKSGPMIYAAFREGLERLEVLSGKKKGMRTVKVLMEEAAGYAAVCLTKEQDPYSVKGPPFVWRRAILWEGCGTSTYFRTVPRR